MTDNQRNPNGTFKPGNKASRGSRRRVPKSILKQAVTDKDVQGLLATGLAKAKDGNDEWAMWFLDRFIPRLKSVSPAIQVELDTTTMQTTLKSILERTASGEISTDQAKDLLSAAQSVATVVKLEELQKELAAVKKQVEEANRARLRSVG